MASRSLSKVGKVYKFVHKQDEYIKTSIIGKEFTSTDGFIELDKNGIIRINGSCYNGYAWDGCTPKWEVLDLTIGTPDGRFDYLTEKPITYYASMIHDALYQYKREIPISRKTADKIFFKIMQEANFFWSYLYYVGVRIGGWYFGKWIDKSKIKDLRIIESSWILKAHADSIKITEADLSNHPLIKVAESYTNQ